MRRLPPPLDYVIWEGILGLFRALFFFQQTCFADWHSGFARADLGFSIRNSVGVTSGACVCLAIAGKQIPSGPDWIRKVKRRCWGKPDIEIYGIDLGWIDGKNLIIDYRFSQPPDRLSLQLPT